MDLTASVCYMIKPESFVDLTPFSNEPELQKRIASHFLPPVVNDLWKSEREGVRWVKAVVHHS